MEVKEEEGMKKKKHGISRIFLIMFISCLLMLLGGTGWKLYRETGMVSELSARLSALSDDFSTLSDDNSLLDDEYSALSDKFSVILDKFSSLWQNYTEARGHGMGTTESCEFTESARALKNPNRGFYHMHGYFIKDEARSFKDYQEDLGWRFAKDNETSLTMIQINLQYFRNREISDKGLESLDNLFRALEENVDDKHLILRFLYDWDGKNMQYEPNSMDTILRHIEQVGPWLKEHKDQIFLTQGLFIGSWGEMHSSKILGKDGGQYLSFCAYACPVAHDHRDCRSKSGGQGRWNPGFTAGTV